MTIVNRGILNSKDEYLAQVGNDWPTAQVLYTQDILETASNLYYTDAAKWIKENNTVEMVIWINMKDASSYGDTAQYISTDAESDGINIWETRKSYFKQYTDLLFPINS